MKLALQMYTVRDAIRDPETLFKALEEVRAMGYEGVEFAGCFGAGADAVRAKLAELGLTAVGCHEPLHRIDESDMDTMLRFYHEVGVKNFVCAGAPTKTAEDLAHLRAQMTALREKAGALGMQVGYHNHAHEFELVGAVRPIDDIQSYCPLELDTYWSFIAQEDTGAYLRKNRSDILLVHLKDGSAEGVPCAIGEGVADIQSVLDAVRDIGLEWAIVENDDPTPDGLSDARRSIENLKNKYKM